MFPPIQGRSLIEVQPNKFQEERKMKKLTALLLALCMMFSLFACGGNGETPASDNQIGRAHV